MERGARFKAIIAILLLAIASPAFAQFDAGEDSGQLRERTEGILQRPEFRHLIRSKKTNSSPQLRSKGESEEWEEGDGEGEAGGRRDKNGRFRKGWERGKQTRKPRKSSDSDKSGSDVTLPSFGGGFGAALGPVFHGLAWVMIAVVVGIIVWMVIKAIGNRQSPQKLDAKETANVLDQEPDQAPGDTAADVYVSKARELAGRGLFREAVAHLLLGAMSHTERAGLIRFRRGLTHRDYLRALRPKPSPHRSMQSMVDIYEPLGFGRREATRDHFEKTLSSYEAGFHARSLENH